MNNKTMLSISEVSQRLNLSESTIYQWLRGGKIPGVKLGAQWRIDPERLDEWLSSLEVREGGDLCPHDNPPHDCNACDVLGDFAFDAAREGR